MQFFTTNKRSIEKSEGLLGFIQERRLHHLLYVSRALNNHTQEQLGELTSIAVKNNEQQNVTGALLYCEGWFIQILEGSKKNIRHIFTKILKDTRHKDVGIISVSPIFRRDFQQWDMAGVILSQDDDAIKEVSDSENLDPRSISKQGALSLLKVIHSMDSEEINRINS